MAKDLQDIIFGDDFTNLVYAGSIDLSSGTFPSGIKGGMYKIAVGGNVGGTEYSAGSFVIYDGTEWTVLQGSGGSGSGGVNLTEWNVTPTFNDYIAAGTYSTTNATLVDGVYTQTVPASGPFVSSMVFDDVYNVGNSSGKYLKIGGMHSAYSMDQVGEAYIMGVTDSPDTLDADINVVVTASGTVSANVLSLTSYKSVDPSTTNIEQGAIINQAPISGITQNFSNLNQSATLEMFISDVEDGVNRKFKTIFRLNSTNGEEAFIYSPNVDVTLSSGTMLYPFITYIAQDTTGWIYSSYVHNLEVGLDDSKIRLYENDNTAALSLLQPALDSFTQGEGYTSLGTPSSYDNVEELPAGVNDGDLLLVKIDDEYDGPTPLLPNGEKTYNERLLQIVNGTEINQIEEVLSYKGEWDVTPKYLPASVISSFNSIASSGIQWDDPSKTFTFDSSLSAMTPYYTVLDRTIGAENTALALEFEDLSDNYVGQYFIIGLTDNPDEIASDLAAILQSSPANNNLGLMIVGDFSGTGNLTIQATALGPLNSTPTTAVAQIPFASVQIGDRLGFYAGTPEGTTNAVSIVPVQDFASGVDIFGSSYPGTLINFNKSPNFFICGVAISDAAALQDKVKNFTFSYPDIISTLDITGTTAEANGITQESLDSYSSGPYLPFNAVGARLVYTSESPEGFQPGDEYLIKNELHESYPVTIGGVSVAPGDLVKTLSSTKVVNISNTQAFEDVSGIVDQVSSPFSETTYVSSTYEGPLANYFSTLADALASGGRYIKVLDETFEIDVSQEYFITGKVLDLTDVKRILFNYQNGYATTRAIFISETPIFNLSLNSEIYEAGWVKFPEDHSITMRATDDGIYFNETVFADVALFGLLSNATNSSSNPPKIRLSGWIPPGNPNYDKRAPANLDSNQDPYYAEYAGPQILFAALSSTNVGSLFHNVILDNARLVPQYYNKPVINFASVQNATYTLDLYAINGSTINWTNTNVTMTYGASNVLGPGSYNIRNYASDVVTQLETPGTPTRAASIFVSTPDIYPYEGNHPEMIHSHRIINDNDETFDEIISGLEQLIEDSSFEDNWIPSTSNGPSVTVYGPYSQYYTIDDAGLNTTIWTEVDPGIDDSQTPSESYLQSAWTNSYDSAADNVPDVFKYVKNISTQTIKFKNWNATTQAYSSGSWITISPGEWYSVRRAGDELAFFDGLLGTSQDRLASKTLDGVVDYLEDRMTTVEESVGVVDNDILNIVRDHFNSPSAQIIGTFADMAPTESGVTQFFIIDDTTASPFELRFHGQNDMQNMNSYDDLNDEELTAKTHRAIFYTRGRSSTTANWTNAVGSPRSYTFVNQGQFYVGKVTRRYSGGLYTGITDFVITPMSGTEIEDIVLPDIHSFYGAGGVSSAQVYLDDIGTSLREYIKSGNGPTEGINKAHTPVDISQYGFGKIYQSGQGAILSDYDAKGLESLGGIIDIESIYPYPRPFSLMIGSDASSGNVREDVLYESGSLELDDHLTYFRGLNTGTQNPNVGPYSLRGVRQFKNTTINHTQVFSLDLNVLGNANANDSRDFRSFIFGDGVTVRTTNDTDNINNPCVYWHKFENTLTQRLNFHVGKDFEITSLNATSADYVPFVVDGPNSPISAELRIIGSNMRISANSFKGDVNVTIVCDDMTSSISTDHPNLNGTFNIVYRNSGSVIPLLSTSTNPLIESTKVVAHIYSEADFAPYLDESNILKDEIKDIEFVIHEDIEFNDTYTFFNGVNTRVKFTGHYDVSTNTESAVGAIARPTLYVNAALTGVTYRVKIWGELENIVIDNTVNTNNNLIVMQTPYTSTTTLNEPSQDAKSTLRIGNNVKVVHPATASTSQYFIQARPITAKNGDAFYLHIGSNFECTGQNVIAMAPGLSERTHIYLEGYADLGDGWLGGSNAKVAEVYISAGGTKIGEVYTNQYAICHWPGTSPWKDLPTGATVNLTGVDITAWPKIRTVDSTAQTIDIANTQEVNMPVGFKLTIVQYGTGAFTLTATSNATLVSKGGALTSDGQYSRVVLEYMGGVNNEWLVSGDVVV